MDIGREFGTVKTEESFDFDDLFPTSPDQNRGILFLDNKAGQQPKATKREQDIAQSLSSEGSYGMSQETRTTFKLEKSRQSARECRARKKLRYQYLDDIILERENANMVLRNELQKYVGWCQDLDQNQIPEGWQEFLNKAAAAAAKK